MFSLHHDGATGKKNPLCRLTQYTSPSACDVIFVCYSAGGARTQCRAGITKKGRCRTGCYVRMRVCMRVGICIERTEAHSANNALFHAYIRVQCRMYKIYSARERQRRDVKE
jgi:hypothetical protein